MDEWSGRKTKFEVFETTDELGFFKDSFARDDPIYIHGLLADKSGDGLGSQEVLVCQVDEYGEPVERQNGELNVLATFTTTPNGRREGSFGSGDEDPHFTSAKLLGLSEAGCAWLKAFFEGDATFAPCESSSEMIKIVEES